MRSQKRKKGGEWLLVRAEEGRPETDRGEGSLGQRQRDEGYRDPGRRGFSELPRAPQRTRGGTCASVGLPLGRIASAQWQCGSQMIAGVRGKETAGILGNSLPLFLGKFGRERKNALGLEVASVGRRKTQGRV